jgi:hypothetical protein
MEFEGWVRFDSGWRCGLDGQLAWQLAAAFLHDSTVAPV